MHHSLWDIQNRHILVDHRLVNMPTAQHLNVQEVLGQRFLCSGDPYLFLHLCEGVNSVKEGNIDVGDDNVGEKRWIKGWLG
jgi:hypothetical protein